MIYKHVALRVLELWIEVDSATLQLLFTDLLSGMQLISHDQVLALSVPDRYITNFNLRLMSPEFRMQLLDVYKAKESLQCSKMYIDQLTIHPIKIVFTFTQTPYPRKQTSDEASSFAAFNLVTSLAGVDRMEVKLQSFIVSGALESLASLQARITAKVVQDIQYQIAQVAGSLSVLGSPMGLARNIGNGLHAFVYEPFQVLTD